MRLIFFRHSSALQEASLPELYRLRDCAAQRISSYLQQKISLLRQPRTNIHIIQRGELLKHKELYLFVTDQVPSSAVALKDDYTRTISSVYASLFKSYHNQLLGMLAESAAAQQQQNLAGATGSPGDATQQADTDDLSAASGKAGPLTLPRLAFRFYESPCVSIHCSLADVLCHFLAGSRLLRRICAAGHGLLLPPWLGGWRCRQLSELLWPSQQVGRSFCPQLRELDHVKQSLGLPVSFEMAPCPAFEQTGQFACAAFACAA